VPHVAKIANFLNDKKLEEAEKLVCDQSCCRDIKNMIASVRSGDLKPCEDQAS